MSIAFLFAARHLIISIKSVTPSIYYLGLDLILDPTSSFGFGFGFLLTSVSFSGTLKNKMFLFCDLDSLGMLPIICLTYDT